MSIVSCPPAASLPITPVGFVPATTTSFPTSAGRSLSRQVRRRAQRGFSKWPTALPRRPEATGTTQDLRRLAAATPSTGLGGVLETSLRGPRIRGALFGPLHSPRGHLQPPPGFLCRWSSHFSLARFRSL